MAGKLAQNKDVAYLSYKLATIKTDVELELTCEQLEVQQPIADELLGLFKKYEFKRWTADVESGKWLQAKGAKPAAKPQETVVIDESPSEPAAALSYENYVTILDDVTLESWIEKLKKRQFLLSTRRPTVWIISPPTWWASRLLSNLALPRMYLSRMIIWTLRIKSPASVLWNC